MKDVIDLRDVQDAQEKLNKSGRKNEQLNAQHLELLVKFYEQIALYSAGAISLSITFIGFLANDYSEVLRAPVWRIQLAHLLYGSWVFFVVAFVASLLVRKYYAYYIAAAGMKQYTKYYELQVGLLKTNPHSV